MTALLKGIKADVWRWPLAIWLLAFNSIRMTRGQNHGRWNGYQGSLRSMTKYLLKLEQIEANRCKLSVISR